MVNLKSLSPAKFGQFVEEMAQPAYRGSQILQWVYEKGATSFAEMTNLPAALRERLAAIATIDTPWVEDQQTSTDGTSKLAVRLVSGRLAETVLIPDFDKSRKAKRITVCVSSQVGCAMGCTFCATGTMGFKQNLTPGEIYDQVRFADTLSNRQFGRGVTNVVYMGMGEPLLNYDDVLSSAAFLMHPLGMGMSPRRITVSTVGLSRRIRQLADDKTTFGLAVSLHAPTDEQRSAIMPVNRTEHTDLGALRNALTYYYRHANRAVTYEYCLFQGVNDSPGDARKLASIARWIPSKVNLLSYNPVQGLPFRRTTEERLNAFAAILAEAGTLVTVRKSRGSDIDAACGQLAGRSI